MISLKLRLIREYNRIYRFTLNLLSKLGHNDAPKVYLFHDLKDDISEVKSQFSITQQSFEEFLLSQLRRNNQPMNYTDVEDIVLNNKKQRKKFIITFDDANESVYTKAYPFLKKHNMPFIVFITKELIGKPGFLYKEQIESLASDELCIVGSHAIHHKMFRYFSQEEAQKEWIESKAFLEKWLNREVRIFAFPYGRLVECSKKNIRQLKSTDYLFAFSAIAGTLYQKWFTGKYFLPRINVSEEYVKKQTEK